MMLESAKSEHLRLTNRGIIFEDFQVQPVITIHDTVNSTSSTSRSTARTMPRRALSVREPRTDSALRGIVRAVR